MAQTNKKTQNPALLKTAVMRGFSLSKLVKAKQAYDKEIQNIYTQLKPYVRFDFFVMFQHGDGFVIVHKENNHNARVSCCKRVIERDGFLDYENYLPECI
jgi:hypothetical protein